MIPSEAKNFVFERLKKDNYRGLTGPHLRVSIDEVIFILDLLKKYTKNGEEHLKIRNKDISNIPQDQEGEWTNYTDLVIEWEQNFPKKISRKSREDNLRKNLFPILEHSGLISRNKKGSAIISVNITNYYSKLSTTHPKVKEIIVGELLYQSLYVKNQRSYEYREKLEQLIAHLDGVSVEEFQFFVSALDVYNDLECDFDSIIRYVKEYRRSRTFDLKQLTEWATSNNQNASSKSEKRDIQNWKNGAQSFFTFANLSSRCIYEKERLTIINKIRDDKRVNRERNKINEYKVLNECEINSPFELHHIIPLNTRKQLVDVYRTFENIYLYELDQAENLIAIDANIHTVLTKDKQGCYKIEFKEGNLIFSNPLERSEKVVAKPNQFILQEKNQPIWQRSNNILCCLKYILEGNKDE